MSEDDDAAADTDDDDDVREFTKSERRRLRRMMLDDDRAEWLKTTLAVWIKMIGAVAVAATASYAAWQNVIKPWFRP
jgi:hypothetical protein